MTLRLGIVRRHDLLVGAFGQIDQGTKLVLPIVRKYTAYADALLGEIAPERFDRLHRELKLHLDWLKDRVRQQHIYNCLSSGQLDDLPHSFWNLYLEKQDGFSSEAQRQQLKRSVLNSLSEELRGQSRDSDSERLRRQLVSLAELLDSIRPSLAEDSRGVCNKLVSELVRLSKALQDNGVGQGNIDLRALRKEHLGVVYDELLEAKAIAAASRPVPPTNSSLVDVIRALHRFLSGQSTETHLIAVLRERLVAAESPLEARILVRFAKRAVILYPSNERSRFVSRALDTAVQRIRSKGARVAQIVLGSPSRSEDVFRVLPGLVRAFGRTTAISLLRANPALLVMPVDLRDAYVSAVKDFRLGLPEEIAARFTVDGRPDLYQSVGALRVGAAEVARLLNNGEFDGVLYKLGIKEIARVLKSRGVVKHEIAADVIGVLASRAGTFRAREICVGINTPGIKVADVSDVLHDLCVRGWVTRDKANYALGEFPVSGMGTSAIQAFDRIKARFKPLRHEAPKVVTPVNLIDEVVREAEEFIKELKAFKKIAVTDIVDKFERVWESLSKRTNCDQIVLLWPPADYAKLLLVRALLKKPGVFRVSQKKHFKTHLNVLRDAGTAWNELLKLHGNVFCHRFVDAMNFEKNRKVLEGYSSNIDYVIAALNLVIKSATDQSFTDVEKLRRHRSLFSNTADLDELLRLVEGRSNDR